MFLWRTVLLPGSEIVLHYHTSHRKPGLVWIIPISVRATFFNIILQFIGPVLETTLPLGCCFCLLEWWLSSGKWHLFSSSVSISRSIYIGNSFKWNIAGLLCTACPSKLLQPPCVQCAGVLLQLSDGYFTSSIFLTGLVQIFTLVFILLVNLRKQRGCRLF